MRKKLISLFLVLLCLFTPTGAWAISLQVDNVPLNTDTEPILIEDRAFVPMRAVLEALEADIQWNGEQRQVKAIKDNHTLTFTLNQKTAYVDGKPYTLPVSPVSVNGRVLLPARFVSEHLGCSVFWDKQADCVFVFTNDALAKAYQERKTAPSVPVWQQKKQTPAPQRIQPEAPKSRTIYITRTGKRYHYDNHCNGGTYFPSTLEQARAKGLTPCKKCVG